MKTMDFILNRKGREVVSLPPQHMVKEALRMMAYQSVGSVVIQDQNGLMGILTERDYARKVALLDRTSASTPIGDIMSPAECIELDGTIDQAMEHMTRTRTRHLVVMKDDKVQGVVSIGDLVSSILEEQAFEIEQLSPYLFSGR